MGTRQKEKALNQVDDLYTQEVDEKTGGGELHLTWIYVCLFSKATLFLSD